MKKTKEKKHIAPNECSLIRWLLVLFISLVGMSVLTPFREHMNNHTDTFMGITYGNYYILLSFIPTYIAFVLAMRFIAKTSVKDFILGVKGKLDKKLAFTLLGLNVAGLLVLYSIQGNMSFRGVQPGQYIFLVVYMLLVLWMQTTVEEFMFRGVILRWVSKNEIGYNKKTIIAALITSFVFMLGHVTGPEVTSQSGFNIVLMCSSYFLYGLIYFWADIHFKSLVPGIVMHWCNNFVLDVIISHEVSVITHPTLLIDHFPKVASWDMVSVLVAHMFVIIYIVVDLVKRKKAASAKTV